MTLSAHAVVGAAIASAIPLTTQSSNLKVLGLAIVAGMISHFLLDSVPHWDYDLASFEEKPGDRMGDNIIVGKAFLFDLFKIGFDIALGLVCAWLLFVWFGGRLPLVILAGAAGGMLPDFLQFVYMKTRIFPFTWLQRVHNFYHDQYPEYDKTPVRGSLLQVFFAVLIATTTLSLLFFFRHYH
jgi:hypothetical protein